MNYIIIHYKLIVHIIICALVGGYRGLLMGLGEGGRGSLKMLKNDGEKNVLAPYKIVTRVSREKFDTYIDTLVSR